MGERRTIAGLQASGSLLAFPQPLLSTFSHLLSIPGLWPGIGATRFERATSCSQSRNGLFPSGREMTVNSVFYRLRCVPFLQSFSLDCIQMWVVSG